MGSGDFRRRTTATHWPQPIDFIFRSLLFKHAQRRRAREKNLEVPFPHSPPSTGTCPTAPYFPVAVFRGEPRLRGKQPSPFLNTGPEFGASRAGPQSERKNSVKTCVALGSHEGAGFVCFLFSVWPAWCCPVSPQRNAGMIGLNSMLE